MVAVSARKYAVREAWAQAAGLHVILCPHRGCRSLANGFHDAAQNTAEKGYFNIEMTREFLKNRIVTMSGMLLQIFDSAIGRI